MTEHLCMMMVRTLDLDQISDERFWVELEKNFSEDHPEYFFEFLHEIGALQNVSFFKRLFHDELWNHDRFKYLMSLVKQVSFLQTPDFRLDVFVALMQRGDTEFSGVTSRSAQMTAALKCFDKMCCKPGPEEVLGLFQKVRAFSEGTRGEDFLIAMRVREEVLGIAAVPFSSKQLRIALDAARTVTATPFLHLEGQEIGIQMNFARVQKIKEVLFRK